MTGRIVVFDRAGAADGGDVGAAPSWLVDRDAYRAVVVDDVREPDRWAELLAAGAAGDVELLDRSGDQLAGWRKRYAPAGEEVGEPAVRWVCYPWRRAVVRVLAPPHFNLLRLDRNRNKITLAEQERFRRVGVAVVGLSVGHVIAHTLVLEGLCGRIALADFDEIELSNLNRIPASLLDLGVNKAVSAARRIAEIDPYLPVRILPGGAVREEFDVLFDGIDVLVEECDSLDVKLTVRAEARRRRVPVLMETSDLGLLDVERFDLDPDRPMLHGLVRDLSADTLRGLSTEEKIPYVMSIIDAAQVSARMAASLIEVERTVSTWPQLGGDVILGGATVAAAVRRLVLGPELGSGRVRVALDDVLDRLAPPEQPRPVDKSIVGRPDPGAETDLGRRLAAAASLAPSAGNMQPWALHWSSPVMRVGQDHSRKQSVLDVGARGAFVAIGAAVESMCVLATGEGRAVDVRMTPNDVDGLVELQVGAPERRADQKDITLMAMLSRRVTNRRRAEGSVPLSDRRCDKLRAAAGRHGVELSVLRTPDELQAYGQLLGRSDRIRFVAARLQADLVGELRWGHEPPAQRATGLEVATLELNPADRAKLLVSTRADVMAWVRAWDLGSALTEPAVMTITASSAVIALHTPRHDREGFIEGGRALQRLWLTATSDGLAVQPVSPAWLYAREESGYAALFDDERHHHEVAQADTAMNELLRLGNDALIIVLRLSEVGKPSATSGRLPLDHVFRTERVQP